VPKRKKAAPIPIIPRFFCDNCGVEVPQNSKNCPSCGRFFSSVRCPYCGFVGEEALFSNGCPSCGYSTSPANAAGKGEVKAKKKKKEAEPVVGLPLWVYILTSAIFTAVLAALMFRVFW
jgi:uncharacterized membrane protein YvbJ